MNPTDTKNKWALASVAITDAYTDFILSRQAKLCTPAKYIKSRFETSHIQDAKIPGVGPKLKEKLAVYGIVTAAQVSEKVSNIPGFGEAKRQALISWRNSVYEMLDRTKPKDLPPEQSERIRNKYLALHNENKVTGQNAQNKKQELEAELKHVLPHLESLSSVTFIAYLNKSLASQGLVSALLASALICSQTVSGFSAATSAILASIPTVTLTSTLTLTPTNTFTPTATFTPTLTYTPTITTTPTITDPRQQLPLHRPIHSHPHLHLPPLAQKHQYQQGLIQGANLGTCTWRRWERWRRWR